MVAFDKNSIVKYWLDLAKRDYQTMGNLFKSEDYVWGLFIGHLVLEKMLKAIYVNKHNEHPPRTHDLPRLAQKSGLEMDDQILEKLETISRFNISVRYPDTQQEFY